MRFGFEALHRLEQQLPLAGLEQALWDLKGRAVGLPVWQMLGGKVRDKVRSYAWIGGDRPHEISEPPTSARNRDSTRSR